MTEEKKKKSPYDDYMQMATDIYNEQKQQNLKQAENQSALAHAQYQEVNRNINEINKAKGLTDTGYQGDTSVDAYNVYRNSVNSAYSNAQASNNQLYSYYLNQMSQLEQAKQNQEFQQEQFEYQKEQNEDQKNWTEKTYNDTIERQKREDTIKTLTYLSDDSLYADNGLLTEEGKTRLINYAKSVYGDNIPADILEMINSGAGYRDKSNDFNKEAYEDSQKSQKTADGIAYLKSITTDDMYDKSTGKLTETAISDLKNAAIEYFGGEENIPIEINSLINRGIGFKEGVTVDSDAVIYDLSNTIAKNDAYFNTDGTMNEAGIEALKNSVVDYYGSYDNVPTFIKHLIENGGFNRENGKVEWDSSYVMNLVATTLVNNKDYYNEDGTLNEKGKTAFTEKVKGFYPNGIPKDIEFMIENGGFNQKNDEVVIEYDPIKTMDFIYGEFNDISEYYNPDGTLNDAGKKAYEEELEFYFPNGLPKEVQTAFKGGRFNNDVSKKNATIEGLIESYLIDEGAFDNDNNITDASAESLWTEILNTYNGVDEIEDLPDSVEKKLKSLPGFEDWLDAYNEEKTEEEKTSNNVLTDIEELEGDDLLNINVDTFNQMTDADKEKAQKILIPKYVEYFKDQRRWGDKIKNNATINAILGEDGVEELINTLKMKNGYPVDNMPKNSKTESNKDWEITGLGSGRNNDNIVFKFDGKSFDLQTGNGVDDATAKELNKLVTGHEDWEPNEVWDENNYRTIKWSEGNFLGATANSKDTAERLVVKDKKMYLYTSKGWVEVKSRNDNVYDAIEAYLK